MKKLKKDLINLMKGNLIIHTGISMEEQTGSKVKTFKNVGRIYPTLGTIAGGSAVIRQLSRFKKLGKRRRR